MANEITIAQRITVTKSGETNRFEQDYQVTLTGSDVVDLSVDVGTSDETITKGDIGTMGVIFVKNLDATNFVVAGTDGTNFPFRINPGETCSFRLASPASAQLHLKADTATCRCRVFQVED